LTSDFSDLYRHGTKLNIVAKRFFTLWKQAEQDGDDAKLLIYAECFRKYTMNIVEVAVKVLGVEELLKGKQRKFT